MVNILWQDKCLSAIDIQFAGLICELAGDDASPELELAAALVSRITTDDKHICLDLEYLGGKSLLEFFPDVNSVQREAISGLCFPESRGWLEVLRRSPVVGSPGEYHPLVLDEHGRLYLYRYWNYEHKLAETIAARISGLQDKIDISKTTDALKKYFPDSRSLPDWQKVAAVAALRSRFTVISGGPGTGKTTVAAVIAAMLAEQAENANFKMALAAPTGKAAARLREAFASAAERLEFSPEIRALIPDEASTVHRLLGYRPDSPYFYHNENNPLAADVVIVDEASMLPLALAKKLITAVPESSRIILLGDKDQLASVEAGAVLADICAVSDLNRFSPEFREIYRQLTREDIPEAGGGDRANPLVDCAVQLQESYRFGSSRGIGLISGLINSGAGKDAVKLLGEKSVDNVRLHPAASGKKLKNQLREVVLENYSEYLRCESIAEAFGSFNRFRILCSNREGPQGVGTINRLTEEILAEKGMINPRGQFYPGRPVIVRRNDYALGLFNGDTGLIWKVPGSGELKAYFPSADGKFREITAARLPEHDTVFAMTVHKSQGSEFERIMLVLPENDSAILTRELLYTAITRAKEDVSIWADSVILENTAERRIQRSSGLQDALIEATRKQTSGEA